MVRTQLSLFLRETVSNFPSSKRETPSGAKRKKMRKTKRTTDHDRVVYLLTKWFLPLEHRGLEANQ